MWWWVDPASSKKKFWKNIIPQYSKTTSGEKRSIWVTYIYLKTDFNMAWSSTVLFHSSPNSAAISCNQPTMRRLWTKILIKFQATLKPCLYGHSFYSGYWDWWRYSWKFSTASAAPAQLIIFVTPLKQNCLGYIRNIKAGRPISIPICAPACQKCSRILKSCECSFHKIACSAITLTGINFAIFAAPSPMNNALRPHNLHLPAILPPLSRLLKVLIPK